jgi:hypothetical protein
VVLNEPQFPVHGLTWYTGTIVSDQNVDTSLDYYAGVALGCM